MATIKKEFSFEYNKTFVKDWKVHGSFSFPLAVYKVLDTPKMYSNGQNYTSLPPHYHEDEMEIFYIRRGACSYFINGIEYKLTAGCAVLTCPKIRHWAYISNVAENTVSLATVFHPRFLVGHAGDVIGTKYLSNIFDRKNNIPPLLTPEVPWQAEILSKYEEFLSYFDESHYPDDYNIHRDEKLKLKEDENCAEIKLKSLLLDIFYIYMKNSIITGEQKKINKSTLSYVLKSIDYIHAHYQEKITLSDLAQCACMSNEYYTRVFMKYMGCRPFVYINNVRIRESIGFLLDTDMSIIDIAMNCGFTTVSYYNLRFREAMNCTPTEYRRRINNKTTE